MRQLVETVTPVLPLAKVERHGWVSIYDNGSQNFDQASASPVHVVSTCVRPPLTLSFSSD